MELRISRDESRLTAAPSIFGTESSLMMPHKYDTVDEWTWQTFRFSRSAFLNKIRDYWRSRSDLELRSLHAKIDQHLTNAAREWSGYDYGHGYLYQSSGQLRLSGRRDTDARVSAFSINDCLQGRSVLDIGCNTGFVALSIAHTARAVTAFDINPHLIAIAKECSKFLKLQNTTFIVSTFEEFPLREQFDVVLSLSNHFTYDGLMCPSFADYIDKCTKLLKRGGYLIFESHTPKFELREGNIDNRASELNSTFREVFRTMSCRGTSLDRNRMLYIGQLI